jgi:DNA-binding transcriptional ArsR family regulator
MSSDAAFRALAEPNRRAILQLVRDHPMSVNEIAAQFEISQQAVSLHLKVLREAALIERIDQGTRHLYVIRPDGAAGVRDFIETMWPSKLDALKAAVETRRARTTKPTR